MKETEIRQDIISYVLSIGGLIWKDRQSPRKPGIGTVKSSNGVPDLLGIWRGKPLAIEVKRPHGIVSNEQIEFLTKFKAHGGVGIIATSVLDVKNQLDQYAANERKKLCALNTTPRLSVNKDI